MAVHRTYAISYIVGFAQTTDDRTPVLCVTVRSAGVSPALP